MRLCRHSNINKALSYETLMDETHHENFFPNCHTILCVRMFDENNCLFFISRSNVPSVASHKKIFSIPYKSQSQIAPKENIALSQLPQNYSTIQEDKIFSGDDDLFEDINPCQFQKEGK